MTIAELMRKMRELGAPPEAIEFAVAAFESQRAEWEAREDARKKDQRERTAKSRRLKKGITNDDTDDDATPPSSDSNVPVTLPSRDSNAAPPSSPPKAPSPQNTPPIIPPHSDPDGSALPDGSASTEVRSADQVWNAKAALADLSGKSEEAVGRWIGKALKDYPPEIVKQGIDAALRAGTRDPFSYARTVMLNAQGTPNGQQATRNNRANSFRQPQESFSDKMSTAMGRGTSVLRGSQAEVGGLHDGAGRPDYRDHSVTIDAVANPTPDDCAPRLRVVGHGGPGSGFGN